MATEDMLKLMIGAYLASLFVAAFLRSRSWRAVGRIVAALILWAGLSYCSSLGLYVFARARCPDSIDPAIFAERYACNDEAATWALTVNPYLSLVFALGLLAFAIWRTYRDYQRSSVSRRAPDATALGDATGS